MTRAGPDAAVDGTIGAAPTSSVESAEEMKPIRKSGKPAMSTKNKDAADCETPGAGQVILAEGSRSDSDIEGAKTATTSSRQCADEVPDTGSENDRRAAKLLDAPGADKTARDGDSARPQANEGASEQAKLGPQPLETAEKEGSGDVEEDSGMSGASFLSEDAEIREDAKEYDDQPEGTVGALNSQWTTSTMEGMEGLMGGAQEVDTGRVSPSDAKLPVPAPRSPLVASRGITPPAETPPVTSWSTTVEIQKLPATGDVITALAVHDKYCVVGTGGGALAMMSHEGYFFRELGKPHTGSVTGISTNAPGTVIASCGRDGTVSMLLCSDFLDSNSEFTQVTHSFSAPLRALSVRPDCGLSGGTPPAQLVTGGKSQHLHLLECPGRMSRLLLRSNTLKHVTVSSSRTGDVHSIRWNPQNPELVAWATDTSVSIHDFTTSISIRLPDVELPCLPPTSFRACLTWETGECLLVGWGSVFLTLVVIQKPTCERTPGTPAYCVEPLHRFDFNQATIAGLAPMGSKRIIVLIVPDVSHARRQPELAVLKRDTKTVHREAGLDGQVPLKGTENVFAVNYTLCFQEHGSRGDGFTYFVLSPTDLVALAPETPYSPS
ncbi:hypothetical protein DIPPA_63551 [Diplonema papillatum]|nr:hypothetical protein DIPPA_63551 [Diplonema papillatum]